MAQGIGLVAAASKPEAQQLGVQIARWLTERGETVVPEHDIVAIGEPNVRAIIVLGGDGLMMRMGTNFPDMPLLGINFGKVGFLALVEQADWTSALEMFLAGEYKLDESSTLAARLFRGDHEFEQGWAINDVVIKGYNRMIEVEVYVDGSFVNQYPSDGLIVSTPRGSTAYCMAAGGPILTPGVKGFAIVAISSHSPIRTPMIAAEESVIELVSANDHPASLVLDGNDVIHLIKGDLIRITKGEHRFRLIRLASTNFYQAIREKFNFQIRPNSKPSRIERPGSEIETPDDDTAT